MIGLRFSQFIPKEDNRTAFDKLLDVFLELMVYTSEDVDEAFDWLRQIDEENHLTTPDYTLDDFRQELENKGYINRKEGESQTTLSAKRFINMAINSRQSRLSIYISYDRHTTRYFLLL